MSIASQFEQQKAGEFMPVLRYAHAETPQLDAVAARAPARILTRHAHDQRLYFLTDLQPTDASPRFRSIELLRNKLPIPTEDRLRFYEIRHISQHLAAEAVANFGQGSSLLRPAARKCQNIAGLKLLTGFDGCAKFTQAIDLETDEHALALTRSLKKTAVNPKKTRQRQSSEKD